MSSPCPEPWRARAERAQSALDRHFARRNGLRADGPLGWFGISAHLWPLARSLFAALDLAGAAVASASPGTPQLPGASGAAEATEAEATGFQVRVGRHLVALERYWDPRPPAAAYASDPGRMKARGGRFVDDNAWVALGLVQLERMRRAGALPAPDVAVLPRACDLFAFARHWWDSKQGGTFWLGQDRGRGRQNHDRNLVSTAPIAQLALHLAELGVLEPAQASAYARRSYEWILAELDESGRGTGPFLDKVRGDGTVDRATWSYNQGSMAGLTAQLAVTEAERNRALDLVHGTLRQQSPPVIRDQPPAFNAIMFRNLLRAAALLGSDETVEVVLSGLADYAEILWERRDAGDLVGHRSGRPQLLSQSALVSVCALLAWPRDRFGELA